MNSFVMMRRVRPANVALNAAVLRWGGGSMQYMSNKSAAAAANPSSEDSMPTPRSLGFDLTYQTAPLSKPEVAPRLAIVCGWMGAKPRQLNPYIRFYTDRGFDVLSFAVGPQHVLQPQTATKLMNKVLQVALEGRHGVGGGLPPSCVVTHSFSVGGYLTGQLLRVLNEPDRVQDKERYHALIKAQVYDSPPDFRSIAKGIGASLGMGPIVAGAIELVAKGYLLASATTAGVEHKASSAHFHNNHLPAPSLWLYSKADPVALEEDCLTVIGKWTANGRVCEQIVWEDTPHIQHGRLDPGRYFGGLDAFMKKHVQL